MSDERRGPTPRTLPPRPSDGSRQPRPPSWAAIRWRQFRSAPRPIVRAVAANAIVSIAGVAALLGYDVALSRGAALPGGDLRPAAVAVYVAIVLAAGTVVTYLIVPQPTGSGERRTRTVWSAMLGFFAAVPIAYLVLVVEGQVLKPFLV